LEQVRLPHALGRKNPHAPVEWGGQWLVPHQNRWRDPTNGDQGRHHLDPRVMQSESMIGTTYACFQIAKKGIYFFDDQSGHLKSASAVAPSVHIPFGVTNQPQLFAEP
jgi:hypothetical protein